MTIENKDYHIFNAESLEKFNLLKCEMAYILKEDKVLYNEIEQEIKTLEEAKFFKDIFPKFNTKTLNIDYKFLEFALKVIFRNYLEKFNGSWGDLIELNVKALNARNEIVIKNSKIIEKISKKFRFDKNDLKQEGYIGLIRAVERYNPKYETKFSTYAFISILNNMFKYLEEKNLIHVPWYIFTKNNKLSKKLSNRGNLSEEEITEIQDFLDNSKISIVSFDKPQPSKRFNNNPGYILEDILIDENSDFREEIEQKKDIESLLSYLPEREKNILKMKFGIFPYEREFTLREIGETNHISHQRIEQIIKSSIKRIQKVEKRNIIINETNAIIANYKNNRCLKVA